MHLFLKKIYRKNPFPKIYRINQCEVLKKNGIWKFDREQQEYTKKIHYQNSNEIYKEPIIRTLYFDNKQHLWVSDDSNHKIDFFYINSNKFDDLLQLNAISSSNILSIEKDNEGLMWCASEFDGIFTFNPNLKLSFHFPKIRALHLSQDLSGNMWYIGESGIGYFDRNKKIWEKINLGKKLKTFFLIHLSDKKKLIATNDGLYELILQKEKWKLKKSNILSNVNDLDIFQITSGEEKFHYLPKGSNKLILIDKNNINLIHEIKINSRVYDIVEDVKYLTSINSVFYECLFPLYSL